MIGNVESVNQQRRNQLAERADKAASTLRQVADAEARLLSRGNAPDYGELRNGNADALRDLADIVAELARSI